MSTALGRILMAAGLMAAYVAHAKDFTNVDKGVDVGDGNVRYDIPYDPKNLDAVRFLAPTVQHPYYEIVVPMGDWTEGTNATIKDVRVNGTSYESYYVFKDGFAHVQSGWITQKASTAKNVVVAIRALWHNSEAAAIEIDIGATGDDGKNKTVTKSFQAAAPAQGGGPDGWRRYQSVALHEMAGVDRMPEPVEFSLVARAENCGNLERELRVFEVDDEALVPVNFQTFNPQEFDGTPAGTTNENYLQHPSKSIDVVFLAEVPADESRVYVVVYDNPGAEAWEAQPTDMTVTGESLNAVVENEFYRVKLDDGSGQIVSFELKGREGNPVPTLTNSLSNAAHWNPDSFSDNGKWGHTFAWNPPDETIVTTRGPILFRIANSGRMPDETPQVHATVSYSFYAGVPYVKCTTVTEVRDELNASAVRNGELVLDSHLVDHWIWEDKDGTIRGLETLHGPNWQDEWATRVDHDVPWLAMTNEAEDYGVGAIVQESIAFNPLYGEATTHRPAYYLYYHHFWGTPVTYFTRGWVYPFSDYQRGPILKVAPQSTYVERLAFMPFYLHDTGKRYADIQNASRQLKYPLVARWGR